MLFRKNMEPSCSYCKHGSVVDDETVACLKRGFSAPWEKCRKFAYDPLKRKPPKLIKLKTTGLSEDDFVI